MEREGQGDLEGAECRVRTEYVVHHHDARPVHDADAEGGAGGRGEAIRIGDRARAQLVQVQVRVSKLQQARTELVLLGVPVLLDKTVRLQSLEQPVHGRTGQPKPLGELAYAEPAGPAGPCLEDRRGAVDRLDGRTPFFPIIRHWFIPVGSGYYSRP